MDHPHSHTGRNPAADSAGLHTVEGNNLRLFCFLVEKKKDTLFSTGKNKNPVLLSGHLDFTSSSRNYHPFLWLIFYHLCSVLSCNDFIISGSRSSYLPVSTPVFVLPSVISHWKPLFWLFFLLYLLHPSLFWSAAPVWVLQTQWAPPTLWDGVLPSPTGGPALGGGEAGIRTII